MASIKALLKSLTGLRGGRYSLGLYTEISVTTTEQTATQDGLLMMRHNPSGTAGTDTILMVNRSVGISVVSGQDVGIIPIAKGDVFNLWTASSQPLWIRFIPWVAK